MLKAIREVRYPKYRGVKLNAHEMAVLRERYTAFVVLALVKVFVYILKVAHLEKLFVVKSEFIISPVHLLLNFDCIFFGMNFDSHTFVSKVICPSQHLL
jgi:hypothetical protein